MFRRFRISKAEAFGTFSEVIGTLVRRPIYPRESMSANHAFTSGSSSSAMKPLATIAS